MVYALAYTLDHCNRLSTGAIDSSGAFTDAGLTPGAVQGNSGQTAHTHKPKNLKV